MQRCGRRSNFGLECLPIFGGGQMVRNGYGQVGNTHPSTKGAVPEDLNGISEGGYY